MSDSENDLLSNNPFHYQNDITVVSTKGPNINTGNMIFRNNTSSTLQLPRNFKPSYAESSYEPSSFRRERSPMSVTSACDARFRNFNNSYYKRDMSSRRSVYNGRGGSPMSVRTIDSTASISASDIAMAFKNMYFNRHDMRIIKDAYNKFMKHKIRKRAEKKRNLKLFMKGKRRRSGYDSGEQASDSSLSSGEGRSIRTGFTENMSSCKSTKTDVLAEFRQTIKASNILTDCSDSVRYNSLKKLMGSTNLNDTQASTSSIRSMPTNFHAPRLKSSSTQSQSGFQPLKDRFEKPNFQTLQERFQNTSFQTQKDRFENGYVLPSKRFDKSVAQSTIPEIQHPNDDTDSDYDLFTADTTKVNNDNRKRVIGAVDNSVLPSNKRPRVVSPCKNSAEAKKAATKEPVNITNEQTNDFEFAKPAMPARKFKDKVISKSGPPIPDIVIHPPKIQTVTNQNNLPKQAENFENETANMTDITQNSELSMRPSFIKRKLFTQKLDVGDKKNISADNLNSPQHSIYSAIQKEKHKARKLVTNQSCLSRDITQDDNNLLDLIHKIVPPNSINITTQSSRSEVSKVKVDDNDKFDVTSIITGKENDENESDTFTDEEIFKGDNNNTIKEIPQQNSAKKSKTFKQTNENKNNVTEKVKEQMSTKVGVIGERNCKVSVEKLPLAKLQSDKNGINKNIGPKCWSSFWDIDSESDVEGIATKRNMPKNNSNDSINEQAPKSMGIGAIFKKPASCLNASTVSMFDTTQRLNVTGFKIRSHRSTKVKTSAEEIKGNTIKSYFETSIRKNNNESLIAVENKSCKKTVPPKINTTKTQKDNKTTTSSKKTPQKDKKSYQKEKKASQKDKKSPVKEKKASQKNNNSQKATKTLAKDKANKKPNVNSEENTATSTEKKNKPNEIKTEIISQKSKTKRTPQKKVTVSQKDKQNQPERDAVKNNKTNKEKQPKNGQIKTKKNNTKENQDPNQKGTNAKTPKKTDNTKNNKTKQKILLENSSMTNSTIDDNSKLYRAIRSCRLSKQNSTLDSSKYSLNLTMTLRSRTNVLSKSFNNSNTMEQASCREAKSSRNKRQPTCKCIL